MESASSHPISGSFTRSDAVVRLRRQQFKCEVWMEKGPRRINAKSIMGVMMLAAGKGSQVVVETDGADEQAAMTALLALIADKFGEGE